jgi:hypothetical protein
LVDFGLVPVGEASDHLIGLTNISKAEVVVTHVAIAGDGAFIFVQGDHRWRSPSGTEITVELLEPWTLEPGETTGLVVRYAPIAEVPGEATLRLTSNDASAPDGHLVHLRGGPPVACAVWEPTSIDFGATVFGTTSARQATLRNCGTVLLDLGPFEVVGDNAGAFSIEGSPPATLAPGEGWSTTVSYAPTTGSVGASGSVLAQVSSEEGDQTAALDLQGFVVLKSCPVAQITVAEEAPAAPGTILHLSGTDSYTTGGTITGWTWSVEPPPGGPAIFFPGPGVNAPTFAATVVGPYHFQLMVTDDQGEASCAPAWRTFEVAPQASVYVEVTWNTPGDSDQTDQGVAVGADLDLHLAHPSAAGADLDGDGDPEPWFDPVWDCYWFNSDPDWGLFVPPTDDDPHLVAEDIDGAGPEAIAFDLPETDTTYRVAVHAWSNHGFGASAATVRVYVLGDLAFESDPIALETGDLWEVADISWLGWPNAIVAPLTADDGGPVIYSDASP